VVQSTVAGAQNYRGARIALSSPVHRSEVSHATIVTPWARLIRAAARALATSVYSRQVQYITVQPIASEAALTTLTTAGGSIEGLVLDSVDALRALARQYPAAVFRDAAEELGKRIAAGCVVSLARRVSPDGAGEIVGYELAEPGVFSALGRRRTVGKEIVFSHWAEVSPPWRGQRVHALLFATRDAYFAQRGGKLVCGVVAPRNRASLQALRRARSVIVGTVKRFALFGAVVWETPWDRIEHAVRLAGARAGGPAPPPCLVDRFTWATK
jgi:hypothetical protein